MRRIIRHPLDIDLSVLETISRPVIDRHVMSVCVNWGFYRYSKTISNMGYKRYERYIGHLAVFIYCEFGFRFRFSTFSRRFDFNCKQWVKPWGRFGEGVKNRRESRKSFNLVE